VISFRTEMVVDHIENDSDTMLMCCIDEAAHIIRPTIGMGRSKVIDPIVAPVAIPRELRHRHDLNHRHTKVTDGWQLTCERLPGSFRSVGADMDLVDNCLVGRNTAPILISPG